MCNIFDCCVCVVPYINRESKAYCRSLPSFCFEMLQWSLCYLGNPSRQNLQRQCDRMAKTLQYCLLLTVLLISKAFSVSRQTSNFLLSFTILCKWLSHRYMEQVDKWPLNEMLGFCHLNGSGNFNKLARLFSYQSKKERNVFGLCYFYFHEGTHCCQLTF